MNTPQASTFDASALVYPTRYQVEVYAGCNLRCPLCHVGRGEIRRSSKRMTLEQFEHVFSLIEPYAEVLYLHMWGEPTLNQDLVDMVKLVSSRKPTCVTNVSTNGNNLSREYAYALVGAGLRQLIVSIDGWDQDSYGQYRIGGKFENVYSFLRYAAEAKQELRSDISIIAQCLDMAHTHAYRDLFEKAVAIPGVDSAFKPLYISGYGTSSERYRNKDVEVQHPTVSSCTSISDALFIQSDGIVIPCCLYSVPSKTYDLGNAFIAHSIEELLLLQDRRTMCEMIAAGKAPNATCARLCTGKNTVGSTDDA